MTSSTDDRRMIERLAQVLRQACTPVKRKGGLFPARGERAVLFANADKIATDFLRCLRGIAEAKARGVVAAGTAGRLLAKAFPTEMISNESSRIRCAWWLLELLNGVAGGNAIDFRGPRRHTLHSTFRFHWECLLAGYETGELTLAPRSITTPTTPVQEAIHTLESVAWTVDHETLNHILIEARQMPKGEKRTALLRDCATLRRYPKRFHFRHTTDYRGRYYQIAPVRWQSDEKLRRALRFADYPEQEIVSLDATSNGLQHISLLLVDPQLMQMTRIAAPADTPHIYDAIMENLKQALRDHPDRVLADRLLTALWGEHDEDGRHLAREYVKGVVMRFPYGGTSYSTRRTFDELYIWSPEDLELDKARRGWLLAALVAEFGIAAGDSEATFWKNYKQARRKAGENYWTKTKGRLKKSTDVWPKLERERLAVLWSRTVHAELERKNSPLAPTGKLLRWFHDTAKAVRDAGANLEYQAGPSWTVEATGFHVERQREPYKITKLLRIQWNGQIHQVHTMVGLEELSDRLDFNEVGDELIAAERDERATHVHKDRLKRLSSFAPNFIHSLDAAVCTHLILALALAYPGVPVVANHDSWGMPEGYTQTLVDIFQDAVRRVHDGQPLQQLYAELKQQVPTLEPPPVVRDRYGPTVDVLFGQPLK